MSPRWGLGVDWFDVLLYTYRPAGALWVERVKSPDLFDIYARRVRNRRGEVPSPIDQRGLEILNHTGIQVE